MTSAPDGAITPEELLALPDAKAYELVDGRLVSKNAGMQASHVSARIMSRLFATVDAGELGFVFSSKASYQCFPTSPQRVRRPNGSFIRAGRFPNDELPDGHCKIPPDLAVEVISPNDLAVEVEQKVSEYLSAGVRLVWVVYPTTKVVHVHRPPGAALVLPSYLTEADTITGEDVLPGFSCPVSEFFRK